MLVRSALGSWAAPKSGNFTQAKDLVIPREAGSREAVCSTVGSYQQTRTKRYHHARLSPSTDGSPAPAYSLP